MSSRRVKILILNFCLFAFLIVVRLFYWQILQGEKLSAQAESQYFVEKETRSPRGEILSRDGFPLVTNKPSYTVYVTIKKDGSDSQMAEKIAGILATDEQSEPKILEEMKKRLAVSRNLVWVALARGLDREARNEIEKLSLEGVGFEEEQVRNYPEGSMSAQLVGFFGKDVQGQDKGYFGLEGYYDRELRGVPGKIKQEKDAFGLLIPIGLNYEEKSTAGRNLILHLDRGIQYITEEKLKNGIEKYGAVAGSVVIMDPKTGGIIAMAAFPNYDPKSYGRWHQELYSNPIVAQTYEPGSTFKVLVMASGLDSGSVGQNDLCDICSGPRTIGEYTIRTWNDKYYPRSSLSDILQHSDNVGMVFIGDKLGKQKMYDYLTNFGIGSLTGIDLEEETIAEIRPPDKWSEIDLATISFGQGIAVTPIQMVTAVSVIANGGALLRPHVVKEISTENKIIEIPVEKIRSVISRKTALIIKEMMVQAVDRGEAKWAAPKGYRIAGKTGTAQIPIAGHYEAEKTIASFIGFAPADDPKFVMLVTLREPKTSQWGSETAAPLWFDIAKDIFKIWGIAPQ